MFLFVMGVLVVLLVRNNFNVQGVANDIRRIARSAAKIVRDLAGEIRRSVKDAKKETAKTRQAAPEQPVTVEAAPVAEPVQPEVQQNNELLKEMERNARTAVMLADVPTLDFPKDDPKYDSSRKYKYA